MKKFSLGWAILIGGAGAAFAYNILLLIAGQFVDEALPLVGISLGVSVVLGAAAAFVSTTLTLYGPREAAWGAGILAPFLSVATNVGGALAGEWIPASLGNFSFFLMSLAASVGGAAAVSFSHPNLRARRKRLRRVK
ncbi:MAG: hypothetical protein ACYC1U_04280 [Candidatus Aquicultorales bacterium]